MPKPPPPTESARSVRSRAPRVAVVGAGLAGLTTALRLSKRGFKVTVYEARDTVGGNLSSEKVAGVYHDVYPHMFCDWYANFWELLETDMGLSREQLFEPRNGVKILEKGAAGYQTLENASTLKALLANLRSGVLPPPEMFLLGFSMLDLASHAFNRSGGGVIDRLDVNGFIYSRGYSTEAVAKLQNYMLMVIWSIQSDTTAAASYQDFVKHTLTFPRPTPFAWMLRGSLYEKIVAPLESKLDCEVRTGQTVRLVEIVEGKPKLTVEPTAGRKARAAAETETYDYVVLAVPGPALAQLVMSGKPGARIVDSIPGLSGLQRFQGVAIPVVDVYFKRKLPDIPKDQVGFAGSDCDLSMLDISQLWSDDPEMKDRTALVLAASDACALPSLDPRERGFMLIKRLHGHLPVFEPGAHWGDPASDVLWEKTHYRSNEANKLFVNDVGSWEWRPVAAYPDQLPTVFFAGDYCQTDVDMATVEAAVQSGLLAARAVQAQDAVVEGQARGDPITLVPHKVYSDAVFLAAKLALLPFAYGASAWAAVLEQRKQTGPLPPDTYSPLAGAAVLPAAFALDWWKTLYWLARALSPKAPAAAGKSIPADSDADPSDDVISLGATALSAWGDILEEISAGQPTRGDRQKSSPLLTSFAAFATQAVRTAQTIYSAATETAASGDDPKRRWRMKP